MPVLPAAFVASVVGGHVATWLGLAMAWRFARSPWFRGLHLAAIAFVVAEAVGGTVSPLTAWEDALRGETHHDGFIQRWIHAWLCGRGLVVALAFSALGAAFTWRVDQRAAPVCR